MAQAQSEGQRALRPYAALAPGSTQRGEADGHETVGKERSVLMCSMITKKPCFPYTVNFVLCLHRLFFKKKTHFGKNTQKPLNYLCTSAQYLLCRTAEHVVQIIVILV